MLGVIVTQTKFAANSNKQQKEQKAITKKTGDKELLNQRKQALEDWIKGKTDTLKLVKTSNSNSSTEPKWVEYILPLKIESIGNIEKVETHVDASSKNFNHRVFEICLTLKAPLGSKKTMSFDFGATNDHKVLLSRLEDIYLSQSKLVPNINPEYAKLSAQIRLLREELLAIGMRESQGKPINRKKLDELKSQLRVLENRLNNNSEYILPVQVAKKS